MYLSGVFKNLPGFIYTNSFLSRVGLLSTIGASDCRSERFNRSVDDFKLTAQSTVSTVLLSSQFFPLEDCLYLRLLRKSTDGKSNDSFSVNGQKGTLERVSFSIKFVEIFQVRRF